MFEWFRSFMKGWFAVQVGIPLLVLFLAGPITLLWMVVQFARGETDKAFETFEVFLIFGVVFVFMLWVRNSIKKSCTEIDERRRERLLNNYDAKEQTTRDANLHTSESGIGELKYAVREILLPTPPPTDPTPS